MWPDNLIWGYYIDQEVILEKLELINITIDIFEDKNESFREVRQ